jgi:hypothetical protein
VKTIITSVMGPPLRRVLCSFLFGAAALCVVPTNIQAKKVTINNPNAIQAAGSLSTAPGDIVWVTTGFSIGKYSQAGQFAQGGTSFYLFGHCIFFC